MKRFCSVYSALIITSSLVMLAASASAYDPHMERGQTKLPSIEVHLEVLDTLPGAHIIPFSQNTQSTVTKATAAPRKVIKKRSRPKPVSSAPAMPPATPAAPPPASVPVKSKSPTRTPTVAPVQQKIAPPKPVSQTEGGAGFAETDVTKGSLDVPPGPPPLDLKPSSQPVPPLSPSVSATTNQKNLPPLPPSPSTPAPAKLPALPLAQPPVAPPSLPPLSPAPVPQKSDNTATLPPIEPLPKPPLVAPSITPSSNSNTTPAVNIVADQKPLNPTPVTQNSASKSPALPPAMVAPTSPPSPPSIAPAKETNATQKGFFGKLEDQVSDFIGTKKSNGSDEMPRRPALNPPLPPVAGTTPSMAPTATPLSSATPTVTPPVPASGIKKDNVVAQSLPPLSMPASASNTLPSKTPPLSSTELPSIPSALPVTSPPAEDKIPQAAKPDTLTVPPPPLPVPPSPAEPVAAPTSSKEGTMNLLALPPAAPKNNANTLSANTAPPASPSLPPLPSSVAASHPPTNNGLPSLSAITGDEETKSESAHSAVAEKQLPPPGSSNSSENTATSSSGLPSLSTITGEKEAPAPMAVASAQPPAPITEQPAVTPNAATGGAAGNTPDLRITFKETETDVPLSMTSVLDTLASQLTKNPNTRVTIMAYAGGPEASGIYPKRVALARGIAVRNYLTTTKGIDIERVNVKALGNKSEGGPADRVDVFVLK